MGWKAVNNNSKSADPAPIKVSGFERKCKSQGFEPLCLQNETIDKTYGELDSSPQSRVAEKKSIMNCDDF